MSIVPLKKVTFLGPSTGKDDLLDALQSMGCLEIIPLNVDAERGGSLALPQKSADALKFLLKCPHRRRQVTDPARFDAEEVERQTLDLQRRLHELEDERDRLMKAIADLKPWGEFSVPPPDKLGGHRFWFYAVPHKEMPKLGNLHLPWEVVQKDQLNTYVVVVSEQEPADMPVPRSHLDPRPRRELERRLEEVELAIEDAQAERAQLTRWCRLFAQGLSELDNRAARAEASGQTLDREPIFALQGWAPAERIPELQAYAEKQGVLFEATDPGPSDEPPTLLRNPPFFAAGEDLINFYMTPGYRTWDPSMVVYISFAIFFAMILADAGYATLLGLGLLLFWKKMGRSAAGLRMRALALTLVVASIVYGVLVGSYFGVAPPKDSFLGRLWVIDMSNTALMMAVSVVVGAIHVVLANVMDSLRYENRVYALPSLGWASVVVGAVVFAAGKMLGVSWLATLGTVMFVAGLLLVLVFAGVGSKPLPRLGQGVLGLTKITSVFGDVLSYLRLFALGLAGSSLAASFNDIASDVRSGLPRMGIVLAIVILLLGHAMNLVLGLSSCVIHGLRLNVIEFFNWGLKDEGRLYQPFEKKGSEAWMK